MYRRAQAVIIFAFIFQTQVVRSQSLRVSVNVEPVLLLLATTDDGVTTKAHGRNSAVLAIDVTKPSSLVQIGVAASGQATDSGCSLSAKLAGEPTGSITVNQVSLKRDSFVLIADLPYRTKEPYELQVKATGNGNAVAANVLFSCSAK